MQKFKLGLKFTAVATLLLTTSCSPTFVIKAAYEESKILLARRDIPKVIADPTIDEETKRKLALVVEAREYSKSMSLEPKESFTTYSRVDKDVLVWVVAGSKPTSFTLHSWWFPVVGHVPYKGFFKKQDAKKQAEDLNRKGYETSVRGADALSTLGWFNDPILSITLRNQDDIVVNTVIHETVHTTLWIKNHVSFNESLANFVGLMGAVEFFKNHPAQNGEGKNTEEKNAQSKNLAAAQSRLEIALEVAAILAELYKDLDALYKSAAPDSAKLKWREWIFQKKIEPLRKKYPEMHILKKINNAELMQLKFYMTNLNLFKGLYDKHHGDWSKFFDEIKKISDEIDIDDSNDPFELLEDSVTTIDNS